MHKKVTCTFKEIHSLVGSINFFGKALPGRRAFNRRFYNATIGITIAEFVETNEEVQVKSSKELSISLNTPLLTLVRV